MGTNFAPIFATLVVGYHEEKLYNKIKASFNPNFTLFFMENWKRFLDNYFIPWMKSENELKYLHDILNNLHQDIKFTLEYNNKQLPF